MEARDTHFSSSMWRVYNHTGGHGVITRSVSEWVGRHGSSDRSSKEDLYTTLLGKVPNKFDDFKECGKLNWGLAVLATLYRELCQATEPDKMSIGGCLLLLQSWNYGLSYVGLPDKLEDISVGKLRDVGCEGVVDSIRDYRDTGIRSSDPTVRVKATNSTATADLKELHKVDMRRKNNEDWREMHKEYIEAWDDRMDFLPIHKPFFLADTKACLEYLSWFKVTSKPIYYQWR
ncbi:hypothetical protein CXB51_017296 [Gossypium anomalum]|uniref:Aminotransferase-like plant mobile domain-containing protein n=1 Tax=Gossypium anomalum TaxID=47600 RepID=A0A8J5YSG8_9ROSI|nr:hypothetical protein CXB51_017296 [Gossypium anomalum]